MAPIHFECIKWRFTNLTIVDIDGVQISVPSYYNDDQLMRYGKTDDKVYNYICK